MSIDPIKAAIALALVALLALAGWKVHSYGSARYKAGQADVQAKWDKANAKAQAEIARLREAAGKVTVRTETVYVDRVRTIREKGNDIIRNVPVYVPAGSPDLPAGFRVLHDAAAANSPIPASPGITDAAPVSAQAAAATVAANYAIAAENAARLTGLQDWVRQQCQSNPPPEGCG